MLHSVRLLPLVLLLIRTTGVIATKLAAQSAPLAAGLATLKDASQGAFLVGAYAMWIRGGSIPARCSSMTTMGGSRPTTR